MYWCALLFCCVCVLLSPEILMIHTTTSMTISPIKQSEPEHWPFASHLHSCIGIGYHPNICLPEISQIKIHSVSSIRMTPRANIDPNRHPTHCMTLLQAHATQYHLGADPLPCGIWRVQTDAWNLYGDLWRCGCCRWKLCGDELLLVCRRGLHD